MRELIFVTSNEHKFSEAHSILERQGIQLVQARSEIAEIQTDNIAAIVDRKAKDAFQMIGRPLFVEHTSLHIEFMNGFPAGLTKPFLSHLGDDRICELFGSSGRNSAFGKTTIGYCDSRRVYQFEGILHGKIAAVPAGRVAGWEGFGWSRIFVPEGLASTLSELGVDIKNDISMRMRALNALVAHLSPP